MRDLSIFKAKLTTGMNNKDLAEQFNISESTVQRAVNAAAERHDLVQRFEDELLKELVPEAVRAVKVALKNDNANVALEILKGAGILKKQRDMNRLSEGGDGDSLELYIKATRGRSQSAPGQPAAAPPSIPGYQLPANTRHPDPEEDSSAARPGGSRDWLPHLEGTLHDHPESIVDGEVVRTEGESVDGTEGNPE